MSDRRTTGASSRWERLALPLTGLSAATFAALSAARRNRVFHPVGEAFLGTLSLEPGSDLGPEAGPHRVMVRFSRGAGLPEPLPDVLGLAVKIGSGGVEQDLLLASSGPGPAMRNLLVPARSFLRCRYSTVLPYRRDGDQMMLGARARASLRNRKGDFGDVEAAAASGQLDIEILAADLTGPWQKVGSLHVAEHCDQETSRELRFDPWNTGPRLRPAGPLNTLRRSAYPASQEARPD